MGSRSGAVVEVEVDLGPDECPHVHVLTLLSGVARWWGPVQPSRVYGKRLRKYPERKMVAEQSQQLHTPFAVGRVKQALSVRE